MNSINPQPAPPMFACIIPSRPVQTNAIAIPPDKVVFEFDDPNINHLVVFLTGAVPLPDGWAASVHFLFPTKPEWQLLGMISPTKPSAIFKLKGSVIPSSTMSAVDAMTSRASLGLHLAPLSQIEAECAHLSASKSLVPFAPPAPTSVQIAKAIGLNLFNYLASFAAEIPGRTGSWVELSTLEKWWKGFEVKCAADPTGDRWLLESVKDT
ncbi:hypothetical protein CROQUDRAFT_73641 [Cronartium quercuum f. sp. fusiforme G11]|uniref:Hikeshi-like domain-containing protein n=1 Tax=Cronartium quercuum f. sp. fusiforme G11 TaxID=708437 RepID=A0A9P6NQX5_9BASI|nr:hypothetical protein CROQUDRAFT_73641 [Cronartium quercuum f. sp. fusiforme G11]